MTGWWTASYVVLWVLVVTLVVVVVALARQIGVLHLRLGPLGALEIDDEGPPLGQAPPPLEAPDADGAMARIGGPGVAQAVVFVSPGCIACDQVLPGVPALRSEGLVPIVVGDDDGAQLGDLGRRHGVAVIHSPEAARVYAVPGTPYAVILDELGVVRAKGTVNNIEQLEGLAATARRRVLAQDGP